MIGRNLLNGRLGDALLEGAEGGAGGAGGGSGGKSRQKRGVRVPGQRPMARAMPSKIGIFCRHKIPAK